MKSTPILRNPDAAAAGGAPAAPAVAAPAADSKLWYEGFSDPKYVEGKGWKSPVDAIESYRNAEKLIGADPKSIVKLPSPTDGIDKWGEVYDRLGRPKDPTGYQFKDPEGFQADANKKAAVAKMMHEQGITAKQAAALYDWYAGDVLGAVKAKEQMDQQAKQQAEAALKQEWKDGYDAELQLANNALIKFGGEEAVAELEKLGLTNHPSMVKIFNKIGKQLLEDSATGKGDGAFATNAQNAQAQLVNLMGDANFVAALMDSNHPNHKNAVEKRLSLFQMGARG